jgi:hypothetical protein
MLCVLSGRSVLSFYEFVADSYYITLSTRYDILFVIFVAIFRFLLGAHYNNFFCLLVRLSVCLSAFNNPA